MKYVIGLVGAQGSGKSTFVTLLSKYLPDVTIESFRSSGVLFEIFGVLRVENPKRERLQRLAVQLEGVDYGTLAHAMRTRLSESRADIVVFDGVRWDADVAAVRSFPKHALVYIERDAQKRFAGMRARKEKAGEAFLTWEQFCAEERAATEVVIPRIGKEADILINNNGTLEEFGHNVRAFVALYKAALT